MTMIPTFMQNAKTASAVPAASTLLEAHFADHPEQSSQIAILEKRIDALWQRANAQETPTDEVDALIEGDGGWGQLTEYAAALRPTKIEDIAGLARIAALVRSQMCCKWQSFEDVSETITATLDYAVSASMAAFVLAA